MTSTAVWLVPDIDAATKAELSGEKMCEHTGHNRLGWQHHHKGPATHYAIIIHQCQAKPAAGTVYPICAPFALYVDSMAAKPWLCPSCHHADDGRNMIRVLDPIPY